MNNSFYMDLATREAWKYQGLTYPNPNVGALILDKDDKILSIESHKKAGHNHGEIEAMIDAYQSISGTSLAHLSPSQTHKFLEQNHSNIFQGATIYVTLEPCNHTGRTPSCAKLIAKLGFARVVIGSLDPNKKASGGYEYLKSKGIDVLYGINQHQTDELLYPFVKWLDDRFVFFKLAQNLNGNCTINKNISSKESKTLVHQLRSNIDLLIIGGNTVRIDRPTLDTRLVIGGKNPDILIVSKKQDFDKSIPLFGVPNRKVMIANNLDMIKNYKFIMIEGTQNMFEFCADIIDWNLTFISPNYSNVGQNISLDVKQQLIYSYHNSNNIICWSK